MNFPGLSIRKPGWALPMALASLMLGAAGTGAAIPQASASSKPKGDSAQAHLGKGYDALKQDRYEIAADEFRAALKIDPKLTLRARFPLALALFEMHKQEESRREFETVRHETGDHPNVLYYLGRIDLEEGKFPAAVGHLSSAMAKPPFPDTAYYLGFAYFKQGDLVSAEKWLKEAVEANPQDARMLYQLGLVYRKQGRGEEAKKTIARSEQLRQSDTEQSKLRIECAQKLEQGPREEASVVCERLYDPDNTDKLTSLGTIYAQHGDLEAALKPLQRAAELAPQSPQTQYNLALAYFQLNRYAEARQALSGVIERWPDLFQLNALYGAVLTKLGEDLQAYQALRHAHELNAQDVGAGDMLFIATVTLARKTQTTGNYREALGYFQEAAKLKPQEPEPHRGMAEVYSMTGHAAEAAAEKQMAERLAKQ